MQNLLKLFKHAVIYFLLAQLFFKPLSANCQIPDSVKLYIDSSLYFMRSKSLFANEVNWNQVKDSVYAQAKNAANYIEAFPAVLYAYKQLKDFHGMIVLDDTSYRYPPPINFDSVLSAGIKQEFLKGPKIVTHVFENGVVYLRVPSMNVFTQDDIDKRAAMLRDSLCMLLQKNPKHIIVDLRMNSGGNSAPMITGISPLFTNTVLGYGVDKDGKFLPPTQIKDGVLLDENGNKLVNINNDCTSQKNISIAVLTGYSTVSSGEILAAFLKQQNNVKLFGERTGGFCNATEGFVFMNEHAYLLLSVNKIADAKKHIYKDMFIQPDVYIKSADNYDDLLQDPTVEAAINWLEKK